MRILFLLICLCLCQNVFADFNSGDYFGKGIIIKASGSTVTGGGRTLNFDQGVGVSVLNNEYNISASSSGGSTNPGGSNTQVQYNNATAFGGAANLVYVSPNVGINSVAPGNQLDVAGTVRTTGFTLTGNGAASGFILQSNGSTGIGTWVPEPSGGSGSNPGGSATQLQYQVNGTTFGGVAGSSIVNGNIGINSAAPGDILDVQGTLRVTNQSAIALDVEGTLSETTLAGTLPNVGIGTISPIQTLNVNGNVDMAGGMSTAAWVDPINDWNASGSTVTTTGTITSGTNSLAVASGVGWAVGMGISVANAGAAGTVPLISYITAISGLTFTLHDNASATATSQTVIHDDTRAIQSAISAIPFNSKGVHLRTGTYNISSALNIANPINIEGDGALITGGTILQNQGTANYVLNISSGNVYVNDLSIVQAAGVTPTADAAIQLYNASTTMTSGELANLRFSGTYDGIDVNGHTTAWFIHDIWMKVINNGLYINNADPAGGIHWHNMDINPVTNNSGVGLHLVVASTNTYSDINATNWDNDVLIGDTNGSVQDQQFIGCAFENNDNDPVVKITGTNTKNIVFSGGKIGEQSGSGDAVDLESSVSDIGFDGVKFRDENIGIYINTTGGLISMIGNVFDSVTTAIDLNAGNNYVILGNIYNGVTTKLINAANSNINVIDHGNPVFFYKNNVGIGTMNPLNLFDVNGTVNIKAFQITGVGNVGINSAVPGQTVDVQGTIRMTGFNIAAGAGSGKVLQSDASGNGTWAANSGTNYWLAGSGGNIGINTMTNVGIGTGNPGEYLDVFANDATTTQIRAVNASSSGFGGFQAQNDAGHFFQIQEAGSGAGHPNLALLATDLGLKFLTDNQVASGGTDTMIFVTGGYNDNPSITLTAGNPGNVGIGSAHPGQMLDVTGTIRSTGFTLTGNGAASGFILQSNGSTGIGTWVPEPSGGGGGSGTVNSGSINRLAVYATTGTAVSDQTIIYDDGTNIGIGTAGPSTLFDVNRKFNVLSGGNVGVGQVAPGALMDVNGTVRSTSFVQTGSVFNNFSGNVGINSLAPGQNLDVNGTIRTVGNTGNSFINSTGGNLGVGTSLPNGVFEVEGGAVGIGTPAPTAADAIGIGTENQSVGEVACIGTGHCVGWCSGTVTDIGGACSACSCLTHR